MRSLLVLLMLLAAAKFGYREYAYSSAAEDIIISTFISEAIAACNDRAVTDRTGITYEAWQPPSRINLRIGKSELDVYPWQTTHPLWQARYRNAYMIIEPNLAAVAPPEPPAPAQSAPALSRVTPSIDESVVKGAALQRATHRSETASTNSYEQTGAGAQTASAGEQLLEAFGQSKRKALVCEYDVTHRTASLLHL